MLKLTVRQIAGATLMVLSGIELLVWVPKCPSWALHTVSGPPQAWQYVSLSIMLGVAAGLWFFVRHGYSMIKTPKA